MIKYVLILCSLFLAMPVYADSPKRPDVFGIQLGSSIEKAARACRKHRGSWFSSKLNLFSCRSSKFNATVEANSNDIVTNVSVSFKQTRFYNEELNSFLSNYSNMRSPKRGANNTVINEFSDGSWVVNFMSYGKNGNYTVHLYNIKDMLNK